MLKILFIAPHLSTGGLPQYLYKKIEVLKNDANILVVEYDDIGGTAFVVQKDRIKSLVPVHSLYGDKTELLSIISNFEPDVIHFEEIPEYFMDFELATEIYKPDAPYKIIETTHDSSYDVRNKIFKPDEFLFVSHYSIEQFSPLDTPSKLAEYPVIYKNRPDRNTALGKLNLDPNKFHILNVGLFTPRKNQAEIIDYAKQLLDYNVEFHFVGNQAGNFHNYWGPLMDTLPDNCRIWGERSDTDNFYSAMDLFLFTSKGTVRDKETNPLSLKEALSWDMDILLYNLPVYLNKYDYVPNMVYLQHDFESNLNVIVNKINSFNFTKGMHK
jgi:glycosyltransferase involved in cell wall biosynthesis